MFTSLVVASTPKELIAQGHLVPYTGYAFDTPDLAGVRSTGGDYNDADLENLMGTNRIVGNVVEQWSQHAGRVRTVVFCVTVKLPVNGSPPLVWASITFN